MSVSWSTQRRMSRNKRIFNKGTASSAFLMAEYAYSVALIDLHTLHSIGLVQLSHQFTADNQEV